jgi:Cu(I)/Ag(I) efflux system membrane fusion protein
MKFQSKQMLYIFVSVILGLFLGWLIFSSNQNDGHNHEENTQTESQIWTCSMHPQIRKNEPGQCPICGMDLIPLDNTQLDNSANITMSKTAVKLANIESITIDSNSNQSYELRLQGKLQANETKVVTQSSHLSGRVEELKIDFIGKQVKKGDILAYIYSPSLILAQKELLESKGKSGEMFELAKSKLLNLKLDNKQISDIIKYGKPIEKFPILSDYSGVVTKKNINQGQYISEGYSLFELTDLSTLWVLLDVHESDLSKIKLGDKVELSFISIHEKLNSTISFIDPVIDSKTRTAKIRLEINNQLNLKPEMFVNGIVKFSSENNNSINIAKSAVLWTGKRSLVYIKHLTNDDISFELREVELGLSTDYTYEVLNGLNYGDEVVTNGAFNLDASAQLAGKPSMMNKQNMTHLIVDNKPTKKSLDLGSKEKAEKIVNKTVGVTNGVTKPEKIAIMNIIRKYINLKDDLVQSNTEKIKSSLINLQSQIKKTEMAIFKGDNHMIWMKQSKSLIKILEQLETETDIKKIRSSFKKLSDNMIILAKSFGPFIDIIYIQHCPMADSKGADWISRDKVIKNPYYGEEMLGCGETILELK